MNRTSWDYLDQLRKVNVLDLALDLLARLVTIEHAAGELLRGDHIGSFYCLLDAFLVGLGVIGLHCFDRLMVIFYM